METEKKKIGIKLDPDLHAKLKTEAVARGITLEEAYKEAVARYLGEEKKRGPLDDVPARLRPCIDMLTTIMASGDVVAIRGLEPLIRAWHSRLQPARDGKRERRSPQ